VLALGGGEFAVQAAHTYATAGNYALSVSISDDGGSTALVSGTASVHSPWRLDSADTAVRASDPERAQSVSIGEATVDLNTGGLPLAQTLDFAQMRRTVVNNP
jgi:hypothetical protein